LVLDGGAQRVYQHVVNFLALLLLLEDVANAILQLHHVLLVQCLLLVQFTFHLAQLEFQGVNLLRLLGLLLEEKRIVLELLAKIRCQSRHVRG